MEAFSLAVVAASKSRFMDDDDEEEEEEESTTNIGGSKVTAVKDGDDEVAIVGGDDSGDTELGSECRDWCKALSVRLSQLSIGKQWKEFLDCNESISFIVHEDAKRNDRSEKNHTQSPQQQSYSKIKP